MVRGETLKEVIESQYLAALEMLARAVEACPEALWDDPADKNSFWLVAYHAIFYAHLYLQPAEKDFRPWSKHRRGVHFMGELPEDWEGEPPDRRPYSKEEVLAYLDVCREEAHKLTAALDPEADSGFYWIGLNKLELQFYNIRHVQQHAGELFERLGARAGLEIDWVGRAPARS